jgi:hypothetical protein
MTTMTGAVVTGRSVKQLKLSQKYATRTLVDRLELCGWATLATLGLVFLASLIFTVGLKLFCLGIGLPAWEFATKSWFSTLTFAGGVVSAGITISSLPELTVYASKAGYATLGLLLSLAVVVAPFFFLVMRKGKVENHEVVYTGYVAGFFIACGVTLLSGLTQLTIYLLVAHGCFRRRALRVLRLFDVSDAGIAGEANGKRQKGDGADRNLAKAELAAAVMRNPLAHSRWWSLRMRAATRAAKRWKSTAATRTATFRLSATRPSTTRRCSISPRKRSEPSEISSASRFRKASAQCFGPRPGRPEIVGARPK